MERKREPDTGDFAVKGRVYFHRPPQKQMRRVDFLFLMAQLAYRFGNAPLAAHNELSDGNQVALGVGEFRRR